MQDRKQTNRKYVMTAVKMRQCAGCGEYKNGKEMLRIVKTPEDEILFDVTGKRSGRGVYICKDETCVEKAFAKKGISRSLHLQLQSKWQYHQGSKRQLQ